MAALTQEGVMLASEEFQNEAVGSLAKACITVRSYKCVFPQSQSKITFIVEKVLLGSRTASVELNICLAPGLQLSSFMF
jgi:hypothetical protein